MAAESGHRPAPKLDGATPDAVRHRDGHRQIIPAAGYGTTELVQRQVADLLADA